MRVMCINFRESVHIATSVFDTVTMHGCEKA